ncbi:beta-hexosaminidase [Anoxybacterium hadale]|uniref:Beta-hexosaminidase n=1 Tax=Anoxybacterium hadale TaxID=3408580 RepID=A0ACD1AEK2_9FIRM|nr:beta-hexosaminidase [Clostridiales bacterium]
MILQGRFLRMLPIALLLFVGCAFSACVDNGSKSAETPGSGAQDQPESGEGTEETPSNAGRAQTILAGMTLEEKVGQMFFVRCRKDTAVADIAQFHPAGFILFGSDIKGQTKESLTAVIQSYQSASSIGLFIGVDEEGGSIVRVSKYREFRESPFPSPQELYSKGGFDLITSDTKEKSALLKGLGFNVNLAPVCDVSDNPSDYIYDRTFGTSAAETAQYVKTVVTAMNESEIGAVLKHFPGYGSNLDTHKGIAVDNSSYESFLTRNFLPFQSGIQAGAESVMVSHTIVTSMDESLPASLSPNVNKILRQQLNFTGVIMTDDLSMKAIEDSIGVEEAAELAVAAGNNLLISTHFDVQIPAVLSAVKEGRIPAKTIDDSVLKILEWKLHLGIIS